MKTFNVLLLIRDPERLYLRISLISMGLLVTINTIHPSRFFEGEIGECNFRIELMEPSVWVSLGLLMLAGWAMFLHSKK